MQRLSLWLALLLLLLPSILLAQENNPQFGVIESYEAIRFSNRAGRRLDTRAAIRGPKYSQTARPNGSQSYLMKLSLLKSMLAAKSLDYSLAFPIGRATMPTYRSASTSRTMTPTIYGRPMCVKQSHAIKGKINHWIIWNEPEHLG